MNKRTILLVVLSLAIGAAMGYVAHPDVEAVGYNVHVTESVVEEGQLTLEQKLENLIENHLPLSDADLYGISVVRVLRGTLILGEEPTAALGELNLGFAAVLAEELRSLGTGSSGQTTPPVVLGSCTMNTNI